MRRIVILSSIIQLMISSGISSQVLYHRSTKNPFRYALFYSSSDVKIAFSKDYKPNILTQKQLDNVKSIIQKVVDSLNVTITSSNNVTRQVDTLRHVFQIVSGKDNKGHSIIWVNAACEPASDWHKRLIYAADGGSCYYNFKITLSNSKYFDLQINANE